MPKSILRRIALVGLCAALSFSLTTIATAATSLASVTVRPLPESAADVSLHFSTTVPAKWFADGNGSNEIVVHLPGTTSVSLSQQTTQGINTVSSVTVVRTVSGLDVHILMPSPEAVRFSQSANIIDVIVPNFRGSVAAPSFKEMRPPAEVATVANTHNTVTKVIQLRYADVSEVAGILGTNGTQVTPQDVFAPSGSIFTLPTQNGQMPISNGVSEMNQQSLQSVGQRIDNHVAIDRRLNAVILSGTAAEVVIMQTLVKRLDIPVSSVMLECEVIELNRTSAVDLGLDFAGTPRGAVGSGEATIGTFNNSTNGGLGNVPIFTADFAAKLYATISHGGGKILASPRILAQNGSPAQILTGDALPIISSTVFPGPPVTTQTSVNYITVGVNLQIQPRITDDGNVTAHIYAEVSSVTAEVPSAQGPIPQISLRQASTTATVADGHSFIIGGLLQDEEIDQLSKIPILGDLPILGELFRTRHSSIDQTNLYVIITPHVVRPLDPGEKLPANLPTPSAPGPRPTSGNRSTTREPLKSRASMT